MAKSYIISTLFLLGLVIIESSILSNISFFIVVPDLILIAVIYLSLLNGKTYGEISGFSSGFFLDLITGVPLGFNCIYRTIIGYLFGLFSESVIISGIIMPVLSVSIGTVLKRVLVILISYLFPKLNLYIYGFISQEFLFEFIINILLAPFIFKFLGFFKKSLSIKDPKDMIDNVK